MRYLKAYRIFESDGSLTPLMEEFLNYNTLGSWRINSEGLVDVEGNFRCLTKIKEMSNLGGIKFGTISGDFTIRGMGFTSLEGCPQKVGGTFDCSHNKLTSLIGSPQKVKGNFICINNQIERLDGCPQEVGGTFDCSRNYEVKSLIGGPVKVGSGYSAANCGLVSLEGCPLTADSLDVEFNELKNLKGAEKSHIRLMMIEFNYINSLEGMPRELEDIKGTNNPVSGETLGKIISVMEANPNMKYGAILASLQSRIPEKDWKKLDKSSLDKMNQTQKKVYGMLGGIGGI